MVVETVKVASRRAVKAAEAVFRGSQDGERGRGSLLLGRSVEATRRLPRAPVVTMLHGTAYRQGEMWVDCGIQ